MLRTILKYSTLVIFLFSVVLIVYLQFNSGQSINTLSSSNNALLKELKTQRDLQRLQTQVITVESDVRGAIITENNIYLADLGKEIGNIRSGLSALDLSFNDPVTDSINKVLSGFVERKLKFSLDIIETYNQSGKEAAENYINTGLGKQISDSIVNLINILGTNRQAIISNIIQTITENSDRARSRGLILAIVAAISSIFAFFHVIIISRKRQKLINVLNESEQREKKAASIKEQFLSNMSHEIRTPLNAILGFTNLLEKTPLTATQQEYVKNMAVSGQNLLNITNEILDLSKIEAGMMRIEKAPFYFPSVIHSIEGMFREKMAAKGISFQVIMDNNIPENLIGDQFRLIQILTNLLSNALKFTEKGKITVEVQQDTRTTTTVGIKFIIKDEGIGIAENRLQQIFERFQQAENDTTRKYGGTGLGLSIVKQLVLLQGGHIDVASKLGQGTEFHIWLPFGIKQGHAAISLKAPSGVNTIQRDLSNLRVLAADDNELNRQLLKHLLSAHQVSFTLVTNGKEVLEAFTYASFNLVLLDIQMPEMNGFEVIRLIREKDPRVPVIAITSYALPGDKEKCLEAGFNGYISKPIQEADLLKELARHQPEVSTSIHNNGAGFVDLRYLRELSGGDIAFEKRILQQFEIQLPKELESLESSVVKHDTEKVKSGIHNLKSTLGYVGLYNGEVDSLLTDIETAVSQHKLQKARSLLQQLQVICNQALDAIR